MQGDTRTLRPDVTRERSGRRTVEPDRCGFGTAGAYRKGEAVELCHEKGRARAGPRCDPSQWRVRSPRIKDLYRPLAARHINPLALAVEENVVHVTARGAFSNGCPRFHVAYAKLWRISVDDNRMPSAVVECHGKIAVIFAGRPGLAEVARLSIDYGDRPCAGQIDERFLPIWKLSGWAGKAISLVLAWL